jgi:DNA-binding XRE family transcriptional regulator
MRHDANLIGRNVATLRKRLGLTQDMLVARVEVLGYFGITRSVLVNIELQRYAATDKHAYHLAKALRAPIADLFAKAG